MFNAKTIDNFISKEECNYLIDTVKNIETWQEAASDYWSNRTLNAINIYNNIDPEAGKLLHSIQERVKNSILSLYREEVIYPDLFEMVRWFPETELPPHVDDMTDAEGYEWFHHRHYGSVIYLNDDYVGGHTFYPNHNVEIIPKAGTLTLHPGDPNHLHGVTKVEGSIRYTIASFWTREKKYSNEWSI